LPNRVPTTTINKICGSAMKAVMLGCDQLAAGSVNVVIAGALSP